MSRQIILNYVKYADLNEVLTKGFIMLNSIGNINKIFRQVIVKEGMV
jgi:hypothetical protein